jgi:DNA-binding PucR family transcriptional regulator
LPAALLTARPDLAKELCTRVLAPVLALDRVSRDLLLDTLAAWLEAGGSAHQAAAALFCHRNTVLNRIRRLERLTRRSLAVPEDLVELALALEAFHLNTVRP